ncbi:MAG: hypothetical protein Q8O33_11985 [Pseudomonadota bacterium]|nr:hypothetical protein [Pseudomonadota bacterium]
MSNKAVLFLVAALALPLSPAEAVDLGRGVQAHGFASQSLVYTSDNRVGGNSDDGMATDMREIGGNLSWRPDADWLLSGQVLARWAGQSDAGDLRLDYGFVDRTLITGDASSLGVRLGKIKNPVGFFNTTRDVAQTRPGIIMPQSIYLDRVRNSFLAAPGISLYGNHDYSSGNLAWQVSGVRPELDDPDLTYFMLGDRARGTFHGKDSWFAQAMLESEGGRWRGGVTLSQVSMKYRRGAETLPFTSGSSRLPSWVLSLEHNTENWSLTGEYSQTAVHSQGYSIPLVEQDNTTESWYLQATRRFGGGWQAFLRYDAFYLDKDDRDGGAFAAQAVFTPARVRFAKDWAVGVRRDIGRWAWSGEWHHVDGTAWLSPTDTPVAASKQKWDMLLLQGAWYF